MAGNKYLERDAASGRMREQASADASTGVPDAGRVVSLNASGEIDPSMLPPGVAPNAVVVTAFEALAANQLVEIFDDGGTPSARLSDASSAAQNPAVGFVIAGSAAAAPAAVYFEGLVAGQVGLIPGQRIYLSETPGTISTVPLAGTGVLHQFLGKAVSTTEFNFEPDDPIELA